MKTFAHFELLEAVELWAADNNLIDSEQALSDRFDDEHAEWLETNKEDQCAIDQQFNDWSDALCKDDHIHSEQYRCYCYVGKYAE